MKESLWVRPDRGARFSKGQPRRRLRRIASYRSTHAPRRRPGTRRCLPRRRRSGTSALRGRSRAPPASSRWGHRWARRARLSRRARARARAWREQPWGMRAWALGAQPERQAHRRQPPRAWSRCRPSDGRGQGVAVERRSAELTLKPDWTKRSPARDAKIPQSYPEGSPTRFPPTPSDRAARRDGVRGLLERERPRARRVGAWTRAR